MTSVCIRKFAIRKQSTYLFHSRSVRGAVRKTAACSVRNVRRFVLEVQKNSSKNQRTPELTDPSNDTNTKIKIKLKIK